MSTLSTRSGYRARDRLALAFVAPAQRSPSCHRRAYDDCDEHEEDHERLRCGVSAYATPDRRSIPRHEQLADLICHHLSMAWEWVGTAGVAVAGIAATYGAGRSGRKHAEKLAREARTQERLADAYVEVLTIAARVGAWAQSVRPILDTNPPAVPPPLPSVEEQMRAEALLLAFGSKAARHVFELWRESAWEVIRGDQSIAFGQQLAKEQGPSGIDHITIWRKLHEEQKPNEKERRGDLAETLSSELAGQPTKALKA
jgi:hypothetical protein